MRVTAGAATGLQALAEAATAVDERVELVLKVAAIGLVLDDEVDLVELLLDP